MNSRINLAHDSHIRELQELEEYYGAKNVRDFYWSEEKGKWIIEYKSDLRPDEFNFKDDLLAFLKNEGE